MLMNLTSSGVPGAWFPVRATSSRLPELSDQIPPRLAVHSGAAQRPKKRRSSGGIRHEFPKCRDKVVWFIHILSARKNDAIRCARRPIAFAGHQVKIARALGPNTRGGCVHATAGQPGKKCSLSRIVKCCAAELAILNAT